MRYDADKRLVSRMLRGEESAFELFFEQNFPRLFRFACTRLDRDEDLAEEIVQRTLCKAITKLASYRGEAALFTWLCTFCRREIFLLVKRDRSFKRQPLIDDLPEIRAAVEILAADPTAPEQRLIRQEVARQVHIVLDNLPPHYSQALEWKYCEGIPVAVIAERMKTTPKAAESILTRARNAFKEGFAAVQAVVREPTAET